MKKYFNKAVLYREWRTAKWFLLVLGLQYLSMVLSFNNKIEDLRESVRAGGFVSANAGAFDRFFTTTQVLNIGTILFIAIYAAVIVGSDYSGRKYETLGTMPFKREEIIVSKWIMGALVIIIPIIAASVLMLISYFTNSSLLMNYLTVDAIEIWALLNALVSLFAYSFTVLIELLTGKNILGAILSVIFMFVIPGVISLIYVVATTLKVDHATGTAIADFFKNLVEASVKGTLVLYNFNTSQVPIVPSIPVRIIVLTAAIIVCLLLSIYAFKKYDLEKIGYVVAFRLLEPVFKIGVSVCFGLLGGAIFSSYLHSNAAIRPGSISEVQRSILFPLTMVIVVCVGAVVYFITNKVIDANKN